MKQAVRAGLILVTAALVVVMAGGGSGALQPAKRATPAAMKVALMTADREGRLLTGGLLEHRLGHGLQDGG